MPCDRIHECTEKSYKSWFDTFCCANYEACHIWKQFNKSQRTPREWMIKLNLKSVDELFKKDED